MPEFGYWLSSEEHRPADLVRNAGRAEEAGLSFALISDHLHPWNDRQGQSPFVWAVVGGIAQVTRRLRLGTAVTCPIIRNHPVVVAQAAATSAAMMPGRFFLGVGTGENLNEHVVGRGWPPPDVRLEMLSEAIDIIRLLWQGGLHSYEGAYFTCEDARLYTLPDQRPELLMAATAPRSARLAGEKAGGLIGFSPTSRAVTSFNESGGIGKRRYGQVQLCWAETEEEALETAYQFWPGAGFSGPLAIDLRLPEHFEAAAEMVKPDMIRGRISMGPDPDTHLAAIERYIDAGFDHIALHQVGPDQEGFFGSGVRSLLPVCRRPSPSAADPVSADPARAGFGPGALL